MTISALSPRQPKDLPAAGQGEAFFVQEVHRLASKLPLTGIWSENFITLLTLKKPFRLTVDAEGRLLSAKNIENESKVASAVNDLFVHLISSYLNFESLTRESVMVFEDLFVNPGEMRDTVRDLMDELVQSDLLHEGAPDLLNIYAKDPFIAQVICLKQPIFHIQASKPFQISFNDKTGKIIFSVPPEKIDYEAILSCLPHYLQEQIAQAGILQQVIEKAPGLVIDGLVETFETELNELNLSGLPLEGEDLDFINNELMKVLSGRSKKFEKKDPNLCAVFDRLLAHYENSKDPLTACRLWPLQAFMNSYLFGSYKEWRCNPEKTLFSPFYELALFSKNPLHGEAFCANRPVIPVSLSPPLYLTLDRNKQLLCNSQKANWSYVLADLPENIKRRIEATQAHLRSMGMDPFEAYQTHAVEIFETLSAQHHLESEGYNPFGLPLAAPDLQNAIFLSQVGDDKLGQIDADERGVLFLNVRAREDAEQRVKKAIESIIYSLDSFYQNNPVSPGSSRFISVRAFIEDFYLGAHNLFMHRGITNRYAGYYIQVFEKTWMKRWFEDAFFAEVEHAQKPVFYFMNTSKSEGRKICLSFDRHNKPLLANQPTPQTGEGSLSLYCEVKEGEYHLDETSSYQAVYEQLPETIQNMLSKGSPAFSLAENADEVLDALSAFFHVSKEGANIFGLPLSRTALDNVEMLRTLPSGKYLGISGPALTAENSPQSAVQEQVEKAIQNIFEELYLHYAKGKHPLTMELSRPLASFMAENSYSKADIFWQNAREYGNFSLETKNRIKFLKKCAQDPLLAEAQAAEKPIFYIGRNKTFRMTFDRQGRIFFEKHPKKFGKVLDLLPKDLAAHCDPADPLPFMSDYAHDILQALCLKFRVSPSEFNVFCLPLPKQELQNIRAIYSLKERQSLGFKEPGTIEVLDVTSEAPLDPKLQGLIRNIFQKLHTACRQCKEPINSAVYLPVQEFIKKGFFKSDLTKFWKNLERMGGLDETSQDYIVQISELFQNPDKAAAKWSEFIPLLNIETNQYFVIILDKEGNVALEGEADERSILQLMPEGIRAAYSHYANLSEFLKHNISPLLDIVNSESCIKARGIYESLIKEDKLTREASSSVRSLEDWQEINALPVDPIHNAYYKCISDCYIVDLRRKNEKKSEQLEGILSNYDKHMDLSQEDRYLLAILEQMSNFPPEYQHRFVIALMQGHWKLYKVYALLKDHYPDILTSPAFKRSLQDVLNPVSLDLNSWFGKDNDPKSLWRHYKTIPIEIIDAFEKSIQEWVRKSKKLCSHDSHLFFSEKKCRPPASFLRPLFERLRTIPGISFSGDLVPEGLRKRNKRLWEATHPSN